LKFAFFSDIHGNLPALEIAIKESGRVDGYIILGDVVNYGPWSNECVQLINSLPNCTRILGNHEEYFIEGRCDGGNFLANKFFDFCYPKFKELAFIKSYNKESKFEDLTCIHTLEDQYIFEDTNVMIKTNYIIGHSHRQYKTIRDGYKLFNPGSVGQNRQYINEINFMIYDTKHQKADFRSVLYDVNIIIKQMEKMEYPELCLDYYRNKPRK
jgi:predicted phosphodiesterase